MSLLKDLQLVVNFLKDLRLVNFLKNVLVIISQRFKIETRIYRKYYGNKRLVEI